MRLAEIAEQGYPGEEWKQDVLNTLGAVLYRAGRFEDAIHRLEEGIRLRKGESLPREWAFLSMAHGRLGHHDEARRWLDRFRSYQPNADPNNFWNALEIRLLRNEADAVVVYDPIFPADPFALRYRASPKPTLPPKFKSMSMLQKTPEWRSWHSLARRLSQGNHEIGKWHGHRCRGNDCDDPAHPPDRLGSGGSQRRGPQGSPGSACSGCTPPRRLAPADIPRKIFEEFRKKAPGISALSKASRNSATVTAYPSHWECRDGQTLLTVDVRGNASYRKTAGWSPNPPGTNADPGRPASSGLDEAKLIEKTRQLAKPWISADFERSLTPAVKRETVLLALVPDGQITEMPGRTIVRLRGENELDTGYFQAVFDPTGAPLRVDLPLAEALTADYCNLALLARIPAHGQAKNDKPLALGCFFDPDEYRFEITALSVEGERFLDLYQAANPFGRDDYDLHRPHQVSARHYSESGDYHWWCWTWWQRYGRVGGFRGNWLKKGSKAGWQYAHNHLLHHRSLASYGLVEGPPRQTKVIERPNEPPVEFPHAVNRHLEPAFYRDLEQCHVAFMFSHGGRLGDFYQMRRGLDVWVVLMPGSEKLGTGNLRHLFLSGWRRSTIATIERRNI